MKTRILLALGGLLVVMVVAGTLAVWVNRGPGVAMMIGLALGTPYGFAAMLWVLR